MVKPITWVWLIYDVMVDAFVRITHFLRYISEFTRYSSVVNGGSSSYMKYKHHIYILNGLKTQYKRCLAQTL